MSKEATLQELGLTHNESKIYLALLEQGCVTAGKVTEKCHLHRANVYDELKVIHSTAHAQKSEASVLLGIKGFTRILDGFLDKNDEILVYGIPKNAPDALKFFIPQYHKRRIAQKITMKHIYNYDAQE